MQCLHCCHMGPFQVRLLPTLWRCAHSKRSEIHPGQILRVVIGYMECQLCGYLSSGIEKHLQNNHFHEEHPLESEVICSKYMSKTNTTGTEAFSNSQQAFKVTARKLNLLNSFFFQFDVSEVTGMTFSCPRVSPDGESCSFSTQALSQMNSHLRKHTK